MPTEDALSPGLAEKPVAEGKFRLENPSKYLDYYGYASDGPLVPAKGAELSKDKQIEATKTEPDKNTYLVLDGATGPHKGYNYGTHFVFQGHENGPADETAPTAAALTRINLDADLLHRVTLMADTDVDGKPLPLIDGSAWDPFAKVLLLTSEEGAKGGVWAATVDFPSKVVDLSAVFGRASYEGVQIDSDGNIWLVEDDGGKGGNVTKNAKQPNSFVYRFMPKDRDDLTAGGKLQVLQVARRLRPADRLPRRQGERRHPRRRPRSCSTATATNCRPAGSPSATATRIRRSHSTPTRSPRRRTARRSSVPRTASSVRARASRSSISPPPATPMPRPRPAPNTAASAASSGSSSRRRRPTRDGSPSSCAATSPTPASTTSSFLDGKQLLIVEDAGDKLHAQRNAYDSGYVIDVTADYTAKDPIRFLAQGRDDMATIDPRFARQGRLPERRRQRDHRHPRLGRQPDRRGPDRHRGADAVRERLARFLHAPARPQHHLRDRQGEVTTAAPARRSLPEAPARRSDPFAGAFSCSLQAGDP